MSGLARILIGKQKGVSGSDLTSNYVTEGLAYAGATVHIGHSANHISPQMTVVYSTDVKVNNPEYQAAKNLGCHMLHRSDLLSRLMDSLKTLAVTGTHGKTTTSSLLAWTLIHAGVDPSFAVGGILPQLQTNGGYGKGEYFVAEADESDGTFLKYHPFGAIVTNIDFDHMDHFGTEEGLIQAFRVFMSQVSSEEHLFWCGDDSYLASLNMPGSSYGFGNQCTLQCSHFTQEGWRIRFDVTFKGRTYQGIELPLIGKHNALNAAAVFGLAITLGIRESDIRSAFDTFQGVARRCEKKGDVQGILFLDDYAHHPTEIETTLHGIRQAIGNRRLVAIFQPHRYSRTKLCLGSYGGIFDCADELLITDIYAAREQPIPGVTYKNVLDEIRGAGFEASFYVPRQDLAEVLTKDLRPNDVVVTLGAGDITSLASEALIKYRREPCLS